MAMRRRSVSPANPLGLSQTTLALIHEAEEQELMSAADAGTVGFMARMMVQVTMPHSMPTSDRFVRTNGRFTIQMVAGDLSFGLPYGSIPRLVLAWMTTALANATKSASLPDAISDFIRTSDPSSGPEGRRYRTPFRAGLRAHPSSSCSRAQWSSGA